MDRSPSFGSAPRDLTRCSHSLSLRLSQGLGLAAQGNSQAHYAKGMRSPPQGWLPQFAGGWFQVLFHSPCGVLFTFPSRYWCTIGRQVVFSLGGWALRIQTGFHVSRPTRVPGGRLLVTCMGLSPAVAHLSKCLHLQRTAVCLVPQPRGTSPPVWAVPLSLAATDGITVVFFSSGYLDVSVPRVVLA